MAQLLGVGNDGFKVLMAPGECLYSNAYDSTVWSNLEKLFFLTTWMLYVMVIEIQNRRLLVFYSAGLTNPAATLLAVC
jgi:hypothetical protein